MEETGGIHKRVYNLLWLYLIQYCNNEMEADFLSLQFRDHIRIISLLYVVLVSKY